MNTATEGNNMNYITISDNAEHIIEDGCDFYGIVGDCKPTIFIRGGAPLVCVWDTAQPRIFTFGKSDARIECYGESKPFVSTFEESTAIVSTYNSAKVSIFAFDDSSYTLDGKVSA
jgi:hypothetical protein